MLQRTHTILLLLLSLVATVTAVSVRDEQGLRGVDDIVENTVNRIVGAGFAAIPGLQNGLPRNIMTESSVTTSGPGRVIIPQSVPSPNQQNPYVPREIDPAPYSAANVLKGGIEQVLQSRYHGPATSSVSSTYRTPTLADVRRVTSTGTPTPSSSNTPPSGSPSSISTTTPDSYVPPREVSGLIFADKVTPEFQAKVTQVCSNLQIQNCNFLMACMAFETGGRFKSDVRNGAGSGATGLIQFMPSTARGLGTTTDALAAMSEVQQLDYVEKYFQPYKGRIQDLEDVYMAILWPRGVGKPLSYNLFSSPGTTYDQNKGLDVDGNGHITKREAGAKVREWYDRGVAALPPDQQGTSPTVETATDTSATETDSGGEGSVTDGTDNSGAVQTQTDTDGAGDTATNTGGSVTPSGNCDFVSPSTGTFTSAFKARWGKWHWGIDIANSNDVPVVAVASGSVTKVVTHCEVGNQSCGGSAGNQVQIRHDNGYGSHYFHLKKGSLTVTTGDTVTQGQQVGVMGHTGHSTGKHLHFELTSGEFYPRTTSNYVDPCTGRTRSGEDKGKHLNCPAVRSDFSAGSC